MCLEKNSFQAHQDADAYFKIAADLGDPDAMVVVAEKYLKNSGMFDEAVDLLRRACEHSNYRAFFLLGQLYERNHLEADTPAVQIKETTANQQLTPNQLKAIDLYQQANFPNKYPPAVIALACLYNKQKQFDWAHKYYKQLEYPHDYKDIKEVEDNLTKHLYLARYPGRLFHDQRKHKTEDYYPRGSLSLSYDI